MRMRRIAINDVRASLLNPYDLIGLHKKRAIIEIITGILIIKLTIKNAIQQVRKQKSKQNIQQNNGGGKNSQFYEKYFIALKIR